MPTYEYACTKCGKRLEAVQKFSDDPLTVCPHCKGKLRKVFSPVGVVFKGSGFYKNDSRSSSPTSAAASSSNDSGAKTSESTSASSDSSSPSAGSSSGGDSGSSESSTKTSKSGSSAKSAKSGSPGGSDSSGGGSKVA